MNETLATASQYGAMGLTLFASFWYINKKDTEYKIERNQQTELMREMHQQTLNVIEKNSTSITELSTLIRKN